MRELADYLEAFAESSRSTRALRDVPAPMTTPLIPLVTASVVPVATSRRAGPHPWSLDWSAPRTFDTAVAFRAFVLAVKQRTTTLYDLYRSRVKVAGARTHFPEPQRILEMPPLPGGECPANGALAYVYEDIFNEAKANLRALGESPPTNGCDPDSVLDWQMLISMNGQLLVRATNIRPMFLFATATDPATTDPQDNYRRANVDTLRTLINYPTDYREGRKERWSNLSASSEVFGPQAVLGLERGMIDARQCFYEEGDRCAGPTVGGSGGVASLSFDTRSIGTDRGAFGRRVELDHDFARTGSTSVWGQIVFTREPAWLRSAIVAAWGHPDRPYTSYAWVRNLDGTTHTVPTRFYVTRWIEYWDQVALALAQLDLVSLVKDAVGFYIVNHNVWYAASLGLTPDQVDAQRRQAQQFALESSPWYQAIRGVTQAAASAISPVAGAIANVMYQIGTPLFDEFILGQFETDSPRPLFVRVPPLACRQVELPTGGTTPTPTGGSRDITRPVVLPNGVPVVRLDPAAPAPQKSGGLVQAGGLAFGAYLLYRFFRG